MYFTQTHISPPKLIIQLLKPNKDLSTCWWLIMADFSDCEGSCAFLGGAPKAALVNWSCHWATSLVGKFLRHLLSWAWCVIAISHRTTKCWSTQRGLACQQADEPREKKSYVSCVIGFLSVIGLSSSCDWLIPRRIGIITILTLLHFFQTSCQAL